VERRRGSLPSLTRTSENPRGLSGQIVTLGTPFFDVMARIAERQERQKHLFRSIAWVILGALFAFAMTLVGLSAWREPGMAGFIFGVFALPLAVLGYMGFRQQGHKKGWRAYRLAVGAATRPFLLAMTSPEDEVRQILRHMPKVANPMAIKVGFWRYLWSWRKDRLQRLREALRIEGVTFLSDLSWPMKLLMIFAIWLLGMHFRMFSGVGVVWEYLFSGIIEAMVVTALGIVILCAVFLAPGGFTKRGHNIRRAQQWLARRAATRLWLGRAIASRFPRCKIRPAICSLSNVAKGSRCLSRPRKRPYKDGENGSERGLELHEAHFPTLSTRLLTFIPFIAASRTRPKWFTVPIMRQMPPSNSSQIGLRLPANCAPRLSREIKQEMREEAL
jgi:hypothetical protein